jgi:predicted MFS family arabinose efflux permease
LLLRPQRTAEAFSLIGKRLVGTIKYLRKSPYLVFLIFQAVAIFVVGRIVQVNLFQPILSSKNIQLPVHGMVMAAMTLFEAFGSAYPHSLRKFLIDRNAVFALTTLLGLALILIPLSGAALTMLGLCLFSLWVGFAYPIQRQLFNDAISEPGYRATLMSIESIVDRAACAVVAALLGASISSPKGLDRFLYVSGGATLLSVLLLIGVFYLFLRRRIKVE